MRTTTYAMFGLACLGLAGCNTVYVQEGPAAAYLPQGVGFYEIGGGDLTNGNVAGQAYIVRTERRGLLRRGASVQAQQAQPTPVGEPIEVFAIEDLGLVD